MKEIPRSGKQLVDEMNGHRGNIPELLAWIAETEAILQDTFLKRFKGVVGQDTIERLIEQINAKVLLQKFHSAAQEFDRERLELRRANERLNTLLSSVPDDEDDVRCEIEHEKKIIKARQLELNRRSALEILINYGLLPNYAFPESGVRFHGSIYGKGLKSEDAPPPIQITRGAGVALRELAPSNFFYTHSRQFEIQQISLGSAKAQTLVEDKIICPACGLLRDTSTQKSDGTDACPQCGYSQPIDRGQYRHLLEFSRSEAVSYMENYDSMSSDRDFERKRERYKIIRSFDLTNERSSGAVGADNAAFGIEYRPSMILREINVGYSGQIPETVSFGPDQVASEIGFRVCADCGVVGKSNRPLEKNDHRRSCSGRRQHEKLEQQGKSGTPYTIQSIYLYRQLRSEVIRLLLPIVDNDDIDTLRACIYLGLRLRFQGDPAHILVVPQSMPPDSSGIVKRYLVLMDAVPGGTGYLKALYQEKDDMGRPAEGIIDIFKRAYDALTNCQCRRMQNKEDTDGCYRCIRTYHLQYNADSISRERGIQLMKCLIEAGEKRTEKSRLDEVKIDSLFGSVLEKKFVEKLKAWVELNTQSVWRETIIHGKMGYHFQIQGQNFSWSLELQPQLGVAHGVMRQCQPDFLLSADKQSIPPVAIFTDGYEYHCLPPNNRLCDDMAKRRAICESGNYLIWNITWNDLIEDTVTAQHSFHPLTESIFSKALESVYSKSKTLYADKKMTLNGFEQFIAFLEIPDISIWKKSVNLSLLTILLGAVAKRSVSGTTLKDVVSDWKYRSDSITINHDIAGDMIYSSDIVIDDDFFAFIKTESALQRLLNKTVLLARLPSAEEMVSQSNFKKRWRCFLAAINLMQFAEIFTFWATGEEKEGTMPDIPFEPLDSIPLEWVNVRNNVTSSLRAIVLRLHREHIQVPHTEYYNENVDEEACAEMAWSEVTPPISILDGEQSSFVEKWQKCGWKAITSDDIKIKGLEWLIEQLPTEMDG